MSLLFEMIGCRDITRLLEQAEVPVHENNCLSGLRIFPQLVTKIRAEEITSRHILL